VAGKAVHQELATPDIWSHVSSLTTVSTRWYISGQGIPLLLFAQTHRARLHGVLGSTAAIYTL